MTGTPGRGDAGTRGGEDFLRVPASPRRLDRLFRPRSVAVVGASPNPSFVSGMFKNLLRYGFQGSVVAVNPKYDEVLGAPCYPSLSEVPGPLDLVIVGVANRFMPALLEECERTAVGSLCVVSSGFSEMGSQDGARRQAELAAWAARTGIPICGPNCLGLMNVPTGLVAFYTAFENLVPGAVGAILQSGQMGSSVLVPMLARDIGISIAVTTGNEADLEAADCIEYLAADEATRVIACFTEQIKTPERFIAACERAAEARKPIVMLKIGRSEASRRSALAHTGALVGSDRVIEAVLRKLGVTRVNSVDELIEAVAVFHAPKLPRGGGVGAVLVSGGAAGMLADLAPECGVEFPPLPEPAARALREIVPEYGSVGNPLDITGQGVFQTEILGGSLDLLATAGNLDILVYGRGFPSRLDRAALAGRIWEQAVAKYPDVLFLVLALTGGHLHARQMADTPVAEPSVYLGGVPFLQGSEYGLKAIAALIRYAAFQRERDEAGSRAAVRTVPLEVAEQARALVRAAGHRSLTEREGKAILALYGIPTTAERLATTLEQARAAVSEIGYPVALKVESPDLLHKTEAGAVLLDVRDGEALEAGYERVLANARRAAPRAENRGVLVQEMVGAGVEVIVGMQRDPQFGPVLACGLGGIFVETLEDVQLLLPPISEAEARRALERLRGYPILRGARGAKPADLDALVDVLLRFGELSTDLGDLVSEIDVNPLVVFEAGRGARAVDCLMVTGER